MNDMTTTIIAKSDQINAADLRGGERIITIKEVHIKAGEDQPVSVLIEGDPKAFRPCKGVRRLMVRVWGADASKYIGQSLTVFCDPSVTWAGKEEGGIRVSHMTGLDEEIIEYMRTSRAATKPYKILPLRVRQQTKVTPHPAADAMIARINAIATSSDLVALVKADGATIDTWPEDVAARVWDIAAARKTALKAKPARDAFDDGAEGPSDEQRGDQHDNATTADRTRVIADDIITRCKTATKVAQIDNLAGVLEQHRAAMTDDMVLDCEVAISDARERVS